MEFAAKFFTYLIWCSYCYENSLLFSYVFGVWMCVLLRNSDNFLIFFDMCTLDATVRAHYLPQPIFIRVFFSVCWGEKYFHFVASLPKNVHAYNARPFQVSSWSFSVWHSLVHKPKKTWYLCFILSAFNQISTHYPNAEGINRALNIGRPPTNLSLDFYYLLKAGVHKFRCWCGNKELVSSCGEWFDPGILKRYEKVGGWWQNTA